MCALWDKIVQCLAQDDSGEGGSAPEDDDLGDLEGVYDVSLSFRGES
jgi:hypothetical protein